MTANGSHRRIGNRPSMALARTAALAAASIGLASMEMAVTAEAIAAQMPARPGPSRQPAPSPAAASAQQAKRFAARFYRKYLELKVLGLPNSSQMAELSPFLSAELIKEFRAAHRTEDAAIKAHPEEKPPFGDGDLFSSLFEGAETFYVSEPAMRGSRAEVQVHMQRRRPARAVRWVDTLVLKKTTAGWRVQDIEFGGKWKFRGAPTLRGNLRLK